MIQIFTSKGKPGYECIQFRDEKSQVQVLLRICSRTEQFLCSTLELLTRLQIFIKPRDTVRSKSFKGTESVILSDPPCKDVNARFHFWKNRK